MKQTRFHNAGGALISALFITAICAIIATALAIRGGVVIRNGELVLNADRAYINLQNAQYWARHQVQQFESQWVGLQGRAPETLRPLQKHFPTVKIAKEKMSGDIVDAQGLYNLNNLIFTASQPQFAALIVTVSPETAMKQAKTIAQAVTDWMTTGKLDQYYLKQKPAYRAPRHQMADKTELRLVDGVSADLYHKLSPYVVALPIQKIGMASSGMQSASSKPQQKKSAHTTKRNASGQSTAKPTPINLNGATWPVFIAVAPKLTIRQAKSLVACRKRFRYFTTVDAFQKNCETPLNISGISKKALTTHSQFYLFKSASTAGTSVIHMNSLLMSQLMKHNKLQVNIVWQCFY